MPPRTRGKVGSRVVQKTIGKPRRQPTKFGELDTSPASHQVHTSPKFNDEKTFPKTRSRTRRHTTFPSAQPTEEFDDGVDDMDLIEMDPTEPSAAQTESRPFAWSEVESTTRRSSPVAAGDTPAAPWRFDDADSNWFSSPKSGHNELPETAPLPTETPLSLEPPPQQPVDFSETASTVTRRSTFGLDDDSLRGIWDFKHATHAASLPGLHAGADTLPDTMPLPPVPSPSHLSINELYDATPPSKVSRVTTSRKIEEKAFSNASQVNSHGPTPPKTAEKDDDTNSHSTENKGIAVQKSSAVLATDDEFPSPLPRSNKRQTVVEVTRENPGQGQLEKSAVKIPSKAPTLLSTSVGLLDGRKRKQRPKPPLQFDEATQEIKHPPPVKATERPRMPLVSKLRDSAQPASSPTIISEKRPRKRPIQLKKKKKQKTASASKANTARPRQEKLMQTEPATQQIEGHYAVNSKPKVKAPGYDREGPSRNIRTEGEVSRQSRPPANAVGQPKATSVVMSNNDPIVLSSDHTDSDDDAFIPESPSISTESANPLSVTSAAQAPRPRPKTSKGEVNRSARRTPSPLQPFLRSQEHAQTFTTDVNRTGDTRPSGLSETESFGDRGSQNPVEVANKTAVVIHTESPNVLFVRDPNIVGVKNLGAFTKTHARKQVVRRDKAVQSPGAVSSRGQSNATLGKQLSRKISISKQGSPVWAQDQTQMPSITVENEPLNGAEPLNMEVLDLPSVNGQSIPISGFAEPTDPPANSNGPLRFSPDKDLGLGKAARVQPEYEYMRRARRADRAGQTSQPKTDPRTSATNEKLRAHMLASLRGQDEAPSNEKSLPHRQGENRSRIDVTKDGKVGQQMHEIVNMMMMNLGSKEEPIHRVPDVYRANMIESVGKIQRRFADERDVLVQTCEIDTNRFAETIDGDKDAIQSRSQAQRQAVAKLEETWAQRRLLYERASIGLRAMHRRLLDGTNN